MEIRVKPQETVDDQVQPILFPELDVKSVGEATIKQVGILSSNKRVDSKVDVILESSGAKLPILVHLTFAELKMLTEVYNIVSSLAELA